MKTSIFVLGAAALLLSSGAASASPDSRLQGFLDHAGAAAGASAAAAGGDLDRQQVKVAGYIAADGRLKSVQVTGSTGSRDTDRAIERSIRRLQFTDVASQLIDAKLTFVMGNAAAGAAPVLAH